jgi:uncharacterized protein YlxW (UPF0749 family)
MRRRPMADGWDRSLPDHVTTPLLTRITEQSMDEDYRQVALRKGSSPQAPRAGRPRLVAASVVVLFGILVTTAAVQTSRNADIEDESRASLISRVEDERDSVAKEQDRIATLQGGNIALEDELDSIIADAQSALSRLRRLQVQTGFVPVTGPGVRIVVDDPPEGDVTELVRDEHLAKLVDGLWNAGAEAIAINDQRLTVLTSIRNRGPAVRVNSQPVNPPYVVQAIGDVNTLQGNLLDSTHGAEFFDLAVDFGFQVDRHNEDELSLPGASGPRLRYVRAGTSATSGKNQEATP